MSTKRMVKTQIAPPKYTAEITTLTLIRSVTYLWKRMPARATQMEDCSYHCWTFNRQARIFDQGRHPPSHKINNQKRRETGHPLAQGAPATLPGEQMTTLSTR
jgi:hypothetical protein